MIDMAFCFYRVANFVLDAYHHWQAAANIRREADPTKKREWGEDERSMAATAVRVASA